MNSPFLRPDDVAYAEILTDAAIHVLGVRGIDRFSVRAMARWMNVGPAAVLNDYSRARVLDLVIICFERRWLAWSACESLWGPGASPVPLRLPATPDECLGIRVLSALEHLAEAELLRDNKAPAAHLDRLRREERALLGLRLRTRCCSHDPAERVVDATMALLRGLRLALADVHPVLTGEAAIEILAEHVAARTVHRQGCVGIQAAS